MKSQRFIGQISRRQKHSVDISNYLKKAVIQNNQGELIPTTDYEKLLAE